MAFSNRIAEALKTASETDKIELAHYLVNHLEPDMAHDSARVRQYSAALDRFVADNEERS